MDMSNQIPKSVIEAIFQLERPSDPVYLITNMQAGMQSVVDLSLGQSFFEEEWKLIVEGHHPTFHCEPIDITIH